MSLRSRPIPPIPDLTAKVARRAFRKGNVYIQVYDALGTFFTNDQFADLYPADGQPATTARCWACSPAATRSDAASSSARIQPLLVTQTHRVVPIRAERRDAHKARLDVQPDSCLLINARLQPQYGNAVLPRVLLQVR